MRALDLFCGGGLSSVGAHAAGFTTVAGVDFNQHALSAFAVNNPQARTYCARVEEIDAVALHEEIGPIDALIAAPREAAPATWSTWRRRSRFCLTPGRCFLRSW